MTAFLATPEYLETILAEMEAWTATTAQTRSAGSLGARPLFVVTAGVDMAGDTHTLQAEMAALSSMSGQHIVKQATHLSLVITQEDAHATSAAILQVVEAAQTGAALN
jgi:hypothetical protein